MLLQEIADGNQEAFRQLFHRYKHKIYTIGLELTGSPAMAEDILQDVFLKIWLNRVTLSGVTHFKAYLFTATRNHIINVLKRERRHELAPGAAADAAASDTDHHGEIYVMEKEYGALLQQAIHRLPQRQAQAYRLMREAGLKRADAAREMGVSEETIKTHFAQAQRNIRAFCLAHLDLIIFFLLAHPYH